MDLNPLQRLLSTRSAPVSVSPSTSTFNWIVFTANLPIYFLEMEDAKRRVAIRLQAVKRKEMSTYLHDPSKRLTHLIRGKLVVVLWLENHWVIITQDSVEMEDQKSWAINLKGKIIRLSNSMVNMIRASPTEIMGWFDLDLMQAWKVIFPLIPFI